MTDLKTDSTEVPAQHRAIGCLVGQAVGDALGSRYEFRSPGSYLQENPNGKQPFRGGGTFNWAPGEFTDDTQMAVILAEFLLSGSSNMNTLFLDWKKWSRDARDVGSATWRGLDHISIHVSQMLNSVEPERSRGNGAVMRVSPVGILGSRYGLLWTENKAREQAKVTHHDPRTVEASVIAAVVMAGFISGEFTDIDEALNYAINNHCSLELRYYFEELLFSQPTTDESNFNGDICLRDAAHAVRTTTSYEDAVAAAVNLGNDADTVGAVTGAIAGALYGIQRIPAMWATYVHGYVNDRKIALEDLERLATELVGKTWKDRSPDYGGPIKPKLVHPAGVYLANLSGVEQADGDFAVVSMCRTFGATDRFAERRNFYLVDKPGANLDIEWVVSEAVDEVEKFIVDGKRVIIHCHAGRSRTGLIAKAWFMRYTGATSEEADEWLSREWPHYAKSNSDFTKYFHNQEIHANA